MKGLLPAIVLLAACSASLQPGASRETDVLARFGDPAEHWQLPDGSRVLEYPRTPLGYENWRVVVAPDGTVRAVEQLIDEAHFGSLHAGMSKEEVRRTLGRQAETMRFANLDEEVWSWRYLEFGGRRTFFNAHFDSTGRLKHTSRTPDTAPEFPGRPRKILR